LGCGETAGFGSPIWFYRREDTADYVISPANIVRLIGRSDDRRESIDLSSNAEFPCQKYRVTTRRVSVSPLFQEQEDPSSIRPTTSSIDVVVGAQLPEHARHATFSPM